MNYIETYQNVRQETINICKPLKEDDYLLQPAYFTSPAKWCLGHTSWFFEEMILKKYSKGYQEFHSKYGYLFNSYYNSLGERVFRHRRGDLNRPLINEVYEYRKYVDQAVQKFLETENITKELDYLFLLGLNHEQQHQELLYTDLKYAFSVNPLFPEYSTTPKCEDTEETTSEFIEAEGGIYEIGYNGDGFCFDNEKESHQVLLQPFSIRNSLVTNGEYLEFVNDNGYERFEFWHDEALAWINKNTVKHPMYWHFIDNEWYQFTLAGLRKLNPEHILTHISYYEAAAFAEWKGYRLPTEFEWEVASDGFHWGLRWEYTESAYLPYPGFKKAPGAVGEYNGKFMVNQKVLRGASVATSKGHSRKTYRNFFHPDMGWQFNGIRLAGK